jgi:hypothetical protein
LIRRKTKYERLTQQHRPHIILNRIRLGLIERQQDERLAVVDARVGEEGDEPVCEEGGGKVDSSVVCVVDL